MKINATINANASGAWADREGEKVVIVDRKPNGLASRLKDPHRHKVWVPTRWLTEEE